MNEKKSFLIHMDLYPYMLTLPMEQRGVLFTALFRYALQSRKKGFMDVTTAAAQFPELSPDGRMAFYFMADSIARDTQKWQEKQANYQAAAKRRSQKNMAPMPLNRPGVNVYPTAEEQRQLLDD